MYARAEIGDQYNQIHQGHPAEVHHLNASDLKGGKQFDDRYDFKIKDERYKTQEEREIEIHNGKALESAMKY